MCAYYFEHNSILCTFADMRKRKTLEITSKVLLFYKKQAGKTLSESAKSLMERDLELIASGKLVAKNANP